MAHYESFLSGCRVKAREELAKEMQGGKNPSFDYPMLGFGGGRSDWRFLKNQVILSGGSSIKGLLEGYRQRKGEEEQL